MSSQDLELDQLLAQAESAAQSISSTLHDDSEGDTVIAKGGLKKDPIARAKASKFQEDSTDEETLQKKREEKQRNKAALQPPPSNTTMLDDDGSTKSSKNDKKASKKDKKGNSKSSKKSKKSKKSDLSDQGDDLGGGSDDFVHKSSKKQSESKKNKSTPVLIESDGSDTDTISNSHNTPITPVKSALKSKMGSKYIDTSSIRLEVNSDDSDDDLKATPMRSTVKVRAKRTKTPTKDAEKDHPVENEGNGYGMLKALFTPDKEPGGKKRTKAASGSKMTEKQRKLEQEKLKKAEIVKLKQSSTVHITKNSSSIVDSLFDDLDQTYSSITIVNKAKLDAERLKSLEESWVEEKKKKLIGEKTETGLIVFGQDSPCSGGEDGLFGFSSASDDSDFDLNEEVLKRQLTATSSVVGKSNSIRNDDDLEYDENENLIDLNGKIIHSHLHRSSKGNSSSDGELSSALDSDIDDPLDGKDADDSDTTDQETWDRDEQLFNAKIDKLAGILNKSAPATLSGAQTDETALGANAMTDAIDDAPMNDDNDLFSNAIKPSLPSTTSIPASTELASSSATTKPTQSAKKSSLFDEIEDDWLTNRPKNSNNVLSMFKGAKKTAADGKSEKNSLFELVESDSSSGSDLYSEYDEDDTVMVTSNKNATQNSTPQSKSKKSKTHSLALNSLLHAQSDDEARKKNNSSSESEEYGMTPEKARAKAAKKAQAERKKRLGNRNSLMGDTTSSSAQSASSEEETEEESEEAQQLRLQRRLERLERQQRKEKSILKDQQQNKYVDMHDVEESDGEGGARAKPVKRKKDDDDEKRDGGDLLSSTDSNSSADDEHDADYMSREELLEQAKFLADDDEVAAELRKKGGRHTGKGSLMEKEEEEWIKDVKREEREFMRQQIARAEREKQKKRMFRHSFFDSGFALDDNFFSNDVIFENTDLDKNQQRLLQSIQLQKGRELTQEEIDIVLGGNAERRALKKQLKEEQQAAIEQTYSATSMALRTSKPVLKNDEAGEDESGKKSKKKKQITDSSEDDGPGGLSIVARLNRTLHQYSNPSQSTTSKKKNKSSKTTPDNTETTTSLASKLSKLPSQSDQYSAQGSLKQTQSVSIQSDPSLKINDSSLSTNSTHFTTTSTDNLVLSTTSATPKPSLKPDFMDIGDDEDDPGNFDVESKPTPKPPSIIVPLDTSSTKSSHSNFALSSAESTSDGPTSTIFITNNNNTNNFHNISDIDAQSQKDDDDSSNSDGEELVDSDSDPTTSSGDDEIDLETLDELDCPDRNDDPDGYAKFHARLKLRDIQRERQQLLLLAQHHGRKLINITNNSKPGTSLFSSGSSILSPNTPGLQRSGTPLSRQNGLAGETRSLHHASSLTQPQLRSTFSSAFNLSSGDAVIAQQRTTSVNNATNTTNRGKFGTIENHNSNSLHHTTSSASMTVTKSNSTNGVAKTQSVQEDGNADVSAKDFTAIRSATGRVTPSTTSSSRQTTLSSTTGRKKTTSMSKTPTASTQSLFAAPKRHSTLPSTLSLISVDGNTAMSLLQAQNQAPHSNGDSAPNASNLLSNFDQAFTSLPSFTSSMNLTNNMTGMTGPSKATKKQIVLSRDVVTATNAFAQLDKDDQQSRHSHQAGFGNNNANTATNGSKNASGGVDFSSFKFGDKAIIPPSSGPVKHKVNHLFDQDNDDLLKSVKKQRRSGDLGPRAPLKPLDRQDTASSAKSLLSSLKSAGPTKK